LLILSLAISPAAKAQSTAVLRGSVIDPSGAAVVHAKVLVKNQATRLEWNNESDSDGLFVVPALPPGIYTITVTAEGFQTAIVSNLTLEVSTTVTQTIQLRVGKISQEVTITAETPVIDTSTVTIGQVVDQKTVQEIPLNGRHFLDLGFLTAGSVTAPRMVSFPNPFVARALSRSIPPVSAKTRSTSWSTESTSTIWCRISSFFSPPSTR
jgi:hypothetical protein